MYVYLCVYAHGCRCQSKPTEGTRSSGDGATGGGGPLGVIAEHQTLDHCKSSAYSHLLSHFIYPGLIYCDFPCSGYNSVGEHRALLQTLCLLFAAYFMWFLLLHCCASDALGPGVILSFCLSV